MLSLMKTGTCLRPSWIAIVWPTISGKMVDDRDHVRTIRFSLAVFMSSIRFIKRSSTNGPFFALRPIFSASLGVLAALAAANDVLAAQLGLVPGAVAVGRLAPRRDRVTAGVALALASAVRVIDRVHGRAAHLG